MLQPDTGAQNTNYRQGSVDSPVQALAVARVAEGDNRRVDSMVTPRLSQVIKLQSHQGHHAGSGATSTKATSSRSSRKFNKVFMAH